MKKSLSLIIFCLCLARESNAQVTQVVVTAVIKLSSGLSFTNSVANGNTNILAAATNSMTKFNLIRASQDPPKAATTNLSQYFIEFTKERFNLVKDEYDYAIPQKLSEKMSTLTESQKDQIRGILGP